MGLPKYQQTTTNITENYLFIFVLSWNFLNNKEIKITLKMIWIRKSKFQFVE